MTSNGVTTEFDTNGNSIRVSTTITTYRQTGTFYPRDIHSRKDLRISFRNFLISCGKSDLVPTELTALSAVAGADTELGVAPRPVESLETQAGAGTGSIHSTAFHTNCSDKPVPARSPEEATNFQGGMPM